MTKLADGREAPILKIRKSPYLRSAHVTLFTNGSALADKPARRAASRQTAKF